MLAARFPKEQPDCGAAGMREAKSEKRKATRSKRETIMQLTIVLPDQLTLIDGQPQRFDLDKFDVPPGLHALQWKNDTGHIEYSNLPNEPLDTLPDWVDAIIEEHRRLTLEQTSLTEKQLRQAVYLSNGQARIDRRERQRSLRNLAQQSFINERVLEKLL